MKKIFTKTFGFVAAIILFVGIVLPAHAQFVKKSYESTNEFYTAVTKDAVGNIYAIRSADGVHASVIKYAPNSTSFTTLFSGLAAGGGDESNAGFLAWGLAVNSLGDVYCTTNLSTGNTGTGTNVVNGVALTNHGNVIKLASNNGFNGTVYTASVFLNGGLYYTSLAFDASNNLYVVQTDNTSLSHYTVRRYPAGSTSGTELFNDLNDDATDNYPHGLAVASNLDIYVCDAGQKTIGGTSGHKGGVRHYVNSSGTYSSHTNVSTNTYPMALALDGSGSLYVSETDGTAYANYRLNKYDASSHALTSGNVTTLVANSGILPDGIAAVNSHDIYVAGGGNPSEFFELIGPATTPASGINFTLTAITTTTINWTNGDGASRAVFVAQTNTGTPAPVNSTNYTANTNFGSGSQAGSGWYCVYNGTGTSVNVTGLTASNTYRAMVVEYNGSVALTDENYLTTSNGGNTANVTTQSPTTINSLNRVTSQLTNASSVNFSAVFGTAVTGVTASNFSVTTTGVSGVTNANIGTPTTSDNITWTVPVTTGTGDGTIQLNLANATGLSKSISTSLPFAGQSYTIDKTAPTVTISSPSVASIADGAGSVTYTVTYADANFASSTLTTGDISLNTTGTATGTIGLTGSGTSYTVTISGISGSGKIGISLAAGTASDGAGNLAPAAGPSVTFNALSTNAVLTKLVTNPSIPLSTVTGTDYKDFRSIVGNSVSSVTISPFSRNNNCTTTINGIPVALGAASDPIALIVGDNTVTIVSTAEDGVTTKTYGITITRQVPNVLASLTVSPSIPLSPVSGADYKDYRSVVVNSISSVTITPTSLDPTNTIKVNTVTVASGTASGAIALNVGDNIINTVVSDGITTKTYSITVTRLAPAILTALKVSPTISLSPSAGPDYKDYKSIVANSISSVSITPTAGDPSNTITVNTVAIASGATSAAIPLSVGDNTITTTVSDGTTSNTYSIKITRLAPPGGASLYDEKLVAVAPVRNTDIVVHQNISPNGDGNSDVLLIDGITTYPDNTLQIMSRNGVLVYEAKGYDNATKVFDGHSSTNGKLQQAGTYFYSLEYKVGTEIKHKTGYLVLKY